MKTIQIMECRSCGIEIYSGSKKIEIRPNEELVFVSVKTTCSDCKERRVRSIGNKKVRPNQRLN